MLSLILLVGSTAVAQRVTRMRAGTDTAQGLQARIFETEEEIRRLDASRVHGEVECARLRRALARLCAAHNQLSPLYRLPDELLARIGAFVMCTEYPSAEALHLPLLAVFRRLRAVLMSTPAVWSRVRLEAGKRMARSFLRRAGTHPVHVVATAWTPRYTSRVAGYEHKITSLEVNGEVLLIDELLKHTTAPEGALGLGLCLIANDHQGRWDRRMWSNRLLALTGMYMSTLSRIPNMPSLRTLHIAHAQCSLPDLHAFLGQSPGLEVVVFNSLVHRFDASDPVIESYAKVSLPKLKRVHLCGTVKIILFLLYILPYPDTQLRVAVEPTQDNFSTSFLSALSSIISVMDRFWVLVAPRCSPLPPIVESGHQILDLYASKHVFMVMEAGPCWTEGSTEPSVHFHARCRVVASHPILARVSRVSLGMGWNTEMLSQTVDASRLDLSCLPHVMSLHFHRVEFTLKTAEGSGVIVNWCMRMLRTSHPERLLRVVEFRHCVDKVGFFRRLKADESAERFVWTE